MVASAVCVTQLEQLLPFVIKYLEIAAVNLTLMDLCVINVERVFITFLKAALTVNAIQQAQFLTFVIQIPDYVCAKVMLVVMPVMNASLELQI